MNHGEKAEKLFLDGYNCAQSVLCAFEDVTGIERETAAKLASSFGGVERSFAIQAGREVRVMVKPEVINDERMVPLAREICKKIEDELDYPGQIKVNIIRESRAAEYAK